MIHGDPCRGADIRACESCARHEVRYSGPILAQHKTRMRPVLIGRQCADHVPLPETAADGSHDKL